MGACYVKPIVLRGYGEVGVNPLSSPIECYMACWSWGAYLGPEALAKGVDVCVSSWTRIAPNTLPAMSKAAANYMNSQLIRMEAALNGYCRRHCAGLRRPRQRRLWHEYFPGARRHAVSRRRWPPAFCRESRAIRS